MNKNIFKQIGFDEGLSEELVLRSLLVDDVSRIVKRHSYSSKELQLILGQPQPEISYLLNGKISRFSSEKLFKFLNALGAKVEIRVKIPEKKIAV